MRCMQPPTNDGTWRPALSREIARFRARSEYTLEALAARAKVNPVDLAKVEEGAPVEAYVYARVAAVLDIPRPADFPHVPWAGLDDLLGVATDTRLADYLGKTREAVRQRRHYAGIERAAPRARDLSMPQAADQLQMLTAVMPVKQAQALLHLTRADVRRLRAISGHNGRSTPLWAVQIGTRPDPEVAAAAGVHVSTVRRWRRKLEIEPYAYFGAATPVVLRKASEAARAFHARRRAVAVGE